MLLERKDDGREAEEVFFTLAIAARYSGDHPTVLQPPRDGKYG